MPRPESPPKSRRRVAPSGGERFPVRPHPHVYEIHTRAWLRSLSREQGQPVSLGSIPDHVWTRLRRLGMDYVWLMGVWRSGAEAVSIASQHPALRKEYDRAVPDWLPEDVGGSPYAVAAYELDPSLGRPKELSALREQLHRHGLRLMLDLVPNHTALDHPWVTQHPEYYVQGTAEDVERHPDWFFRSGTRGRERWIAHGRDPYFAPWRDTAQVNVWHPGLRQALGQLLNTLTTLCDGLRCDMSMLLLNDVFRHTWGEQLTRMRAEEPPTEYWSDMIGAVKTQHPEFFLMAEAYWGLEWRLQQLGFDCTYDKTLYDRLRDGETAGVRGHLTAEASYQCRSVRFVENHDEPRAVEAFGRERSLAAAVVALTVPGPRLVHDGQLEGRRIRLPIQLTRLPDERIDWNLHEQYERLLVAVHHRVFHTGSWSLCDVAPSGEATETTSSEARRPTGDASKQLLAWQWRESDEARLVVVNYGDATVRGLVRWPLPGVSAKRVLPLEEVLCGKDDSSSTAEWRNGGVMVALEPYGVRMFSAAGVVK